MASCGNYGVGISPYAALPFRRRCAAPAFSKRWRVAAASDKDRILESLEDVSSSLAALSDAISKVMLSVQRLAAAVRDEEPSSAPAAASPDVVPDGDGNPSVADHPRENALSHEIAFKLQQSFLQSRIEGLGKPFEVAVEDFVDECIRARENGIGMQELQLQLILADGALTGAFSLSSEKASFIIGEEARIRAAWVRYVYVTLTEVEKIQNKIVDLTLEGQEDSSDLFVRQVIKMAVDEGYTLEKLKLEQRFSGPTTSPSVKALRESSFLILLAFEKGMATK